MTKKKDDTKIAISMNGGKEIETSVEDLKNGIDTLNGYGRKMKNEKVYCRCVFTEDELREIAKQTAAKIRERTNIDNDRKRVAADFKAKMDALDSELGKLSGDYDSGYEMRNVECAVFVNFTDNKKRWVRSDTGAVEKESRLTIEDRQMEFPQDKPADKPE
jgi:hypothetical protein